MTDPLFRKAMFFTDAHFGRNGNNPIAIEDNVEFMEWAIDCARTWGAETCIFGGDWFHDRAKVGVTTLDSSLSVAETLGNSFENVYCLIGNHDTPFRHTRESASVEFMRNIPNVTVVRDPLTIGNVTFLPWLVGDEQHTIRNIKSRYVFGHLEMSGFMMNARVVAPDAPHMTKPDQFDGAEYVFSGHFHSRQVQRYKNTTIVYTGNIMPFDFSDSWDEERGIMLLEWGKDPVFRTWPDQPVYRTMKLSELVSKPKMFLRKKLVARVSIDFEINFEEAQEVREKLAVEYGVRRIEFAHVPKQEAAQSFIDVSVEFRSIDQIVIEGLMSVNSVGIQPSRLVGIYKSLSF